MDVLRNLNTETLQRQALLREEEYATAILIVSRIL